ncbi:hypothetical protein VTN00DRAFT_7216 [Thermoascus crustaceus]|uniref:uncharacterized protein n=1 Tax=Thermoascus crustaceus TaxID=5088 RepID=UPI003744718F
MDPTASKLELVMHPKAAFITIGTSERKGRHRQHSWTPIVRLLNQSDNFDVPNGYKWRLDGVSSDGTRFFAYPELAANDMPMRIDVYIRDQAEHSSLTRHVLHTNGTMFCKSIEDIRGLRFSRHLLKSLELWSSNQPNFEEMYFQLPFGSYIAVDTISLYVRNMNIHCVPCYETEQQWLSPAQLQKLWHSDVPVQSWPDMIPLTQLSLQTQPRDSISLVTIPHLGSSRIFVFKSILHDMRYMYHELKMLLSMPPHPNIIQKPLYLVTHQRRFGGIGVCGFILSYYPLGTLQQMLWQASISNTIHMKTRCQWAREITEALLHIQSTSSAEFYTGLKPGNIVMTRRGDNNDRVETVLLDFEQRTGRYTWSPPEVRYVSYFEHVVASETAPMEIKEKYRAMLRAYYPDWQPDWLVRPYRNPRLGYSGPWLALTPQERESAEVFMLGKLLWCIFEGVPCIDDGLNFDTFREPYCAQRFPGFRRSPQLIRDCIRRCTAGAPEWRGRFPAVAKCGNKLFPYGWDSSCGSDDDNDQVAEAVSEEDTLQAAKTWWEEELRDAERFFHAFYRHKAGEEKQPGDEEILSFLGQRPTLMHVLDVIQNVECRI